jgi:universal stress protein A
MPAAPPPSRKSSSLRSAGPGVAIVAIDFSDASQNALRKAQEWAAARSADELVLLYVNDTMEQAVTDAMTPQLLEMSKQRHAEAEKNLAALVSELHRNGLKARSLICDGVPHDRIIKTALAENASLIVMGTHGRTRLAHLLIGSVAERVVREAPCPVLVVPISGRRTGKPP